MCQEATLLRIRGQRYEESYRWPKLLRDGNMQLSAASFIRFNAYTLARNNTLTAIFHSAVRGLEMIVRSSFFIATCMLFSASSALAQTADFLLDVGIVYPSCPITVNVSSHPVPPNGEVGYISSPEGGTVEAYAGGMKNLRGKAIAVKLPAKVVTTASGQTASIDQNTCAGAAVVLRDKPLHLIIGSHMRINTTLKGSWNNGGTGSILTSIHQLDTGNVPYTSELVMLSGPTLQTDSKQQIDRVLVTDHNLETHVNFYINAQIRSDAEAESAFADFSNTAHAYFDSLSPDQDLSWASGLSHSDPDFKRQAPVLTDTSGHPPLATSNPSGSMQSRDSKVLGGGAASSDFLVYSGPISISNNIATVSDQSWSAGASSDIASASAIDVRAIQFPDPSNRYAVDVKQESGKASEPSSRGFAVAALPSGFVMTGGGCRISAPPANAASHRSQPYQAFLTGSYPDETDQNRWICEAQLSPKAKLGVVSNSYWGSNLTAYVIGIRPLASTTPIPVLRISKRTSSTGTDPVVTADLFASGFLITGGGGRVIRSRQSKVKVPSYLTGMLPLFQAGASTQPATQWQVSARGAEGSDLSNTTLTSYALNILFQPPKIVSINPQQAAPGATVSITGENFVSNMKVRFGTTDVPATVSSVYDATAIVPSGFAAGNIPVQLLAGDVPSDSYQFTVLP
jgi:hypothetical protein